MSIASDDVLHLSKDLIGSVEQLRQEFAHLMERDQQLRDATIEELKRGFQYQAATIEELKRGLQFQAATIEELERSIGLKETKIEKLEGSLQMKEATIEELELRLEYVEAITRKDGESLLHKLKWCAPFSSLVAVSTHKIENILVPKTCDDLKKLGVAKSGAYLIDPDGAGIGDAPITVDCDMTGDAGNSNFKVNLWFHIARQWTRAMNQETTINRCYRHYKNTTWHDGVDWGEPLRGAWLRRLSNFLPGQRQADQGSDSVVLAMQPVIFCKFIRQL